VTGIGAGEGSDKGLGVVGLVFFDLRQRGLVGDRITLCGTNGTKFPKIRRKFKDGLEMKYRGMQCYFESFPADDVRRDTKAYLKALQTAKSGDIAIIFTPDDTHFEITMACLNKELHVMCTKPVVKSLEEHIQLAKKATEMNCHLQIEVHKRFDPIYSDAHSRIQTLGDFAYFNSYMSQPKYQLEVFKSWAGISSDISYYLNSHHIDFHCWAIQGRAVPFEVSASSSTGVANKLLQRPCEDSITLLVKWRTLKSGNLGTAVYTASWTAAKGDVHSQQRFYYQAANGDVRIDQAHRGYFYTTDENGMQSVNPLFWRYTPDTLGNFKGQNTYGYKSFEEFVLAVRAIGNKEATPQTFDKNLPTIRSTVYVTAILEAGRLSLDKNRPFIIVSERDKIAIRPKLLTTLSQQRTESQLDQKY